jgi:diguanylate cyclase (GGDEF)-like protein
MGVTTVMLSTLDLDYILYVILSGITSGDGLGFNRALLFLDDAEGRALRVKLAVGPESLEEAERIWNAIEHENINFVDLLPRFEAFQNDTACQKLTRKMSTVVLPLNRLDQLAASPHTLILSHEAPLAAVLARCLVNRTPFASNSLALRQEVGGTGGEMLDLQNVAIVPLVVERDLIGAIVADNAFTGKEVDSEGLRSLHAMGNLAALAIDRARLHARTVAMAEVDGLTGVYNRRYYSEALEKALVAAEQGGQPLSIIVFDVDHFKRYNDEHGHLVGDELLKDVAGLLVKHLRASDMIARYGGEEFVVLLKDTPAESALQVAEKLRTIICKTPLAQGRIENLTLSAGVASTGGGETADQLFARADQSLYEAKKNGRDKAVLSETRT